MTNALLELNSLKPSENTRNSHSAPDSQYKAPWNTTSWRWLALFLMNLLLLGDYVVIDTPQALETQLEEALGLSTQEYSYLYSSWALPSIVVPIIGGYLTDFLGVRTTLVMSCVGLTIGELIYYYGTVSLSFSWMLFGRAVYALGSNPLNVAQMVIIFKWFQGRELALAMAISSTTSCVGRALNSFAVPKLYEAYQNLNAPTLFGVIICFISAIACAVVVYWDKENDKRELAYEIDSSKEGEVEKTEKVSLTDIKYFKPAVWLLVINFGLTDGYFFSFNVFSNSFYHDKYEFSNSAAGNIISLNYIFGAISSIFFGYLIDKKGYRASIILYNSLLGVFAFFYYIMVPECPQCISTVFPQILFGLLIGINDAAVFPSLPLLLDEKYIGTGYGLFFVVQNFFMLILPPISAYIKDATSETSGGFFWMLMFFFVLSILTTFESFVLFLQDRKLGRVLDLSVVKDEDEQEQLLEEEEERRSSVSSQSSILKKSKARKIKKNSSGPLVMDVEMVKLNSLYRPPVYSD